VTVTVTVKETKQNISNVCKQKHMVEEELPLVCHKKVVQ